MSGPAFIALASATAAAFVALLFARAVWHKATDFTAFTGFVADYRLLPARLVTPAAAALVVAEAAIVVAFVVPGGHVLAALLASGLLLAYAGAMAINIHRGRDRIECGCGGAAQPLGWTLVARNLVLAGIALAATPSSPFGLSVDEALAAMTSGLTLWTGFVMVEQILANGTHARLSR